ncbi:MAG: hypothetical protein K6T90_06465 [Leptolyngbyaceae cyanobacterium HOT.MB2.61]|jgi:hypothetical protein|nr:hypothetical protein [Leptolyngbyaceae cyanobacterium HOT.MB2.61]
MAGTPLQGTETDPGASLRVLVDRNFTEGRCCRESGATHLLIHSCHLPWLRFF